MLSARLDLEYRIFKTQHILLYVLHLHTTLQIFPIPENVIIDFKRFAPNHTTEWIMEAFLLA